MHKSDYTGVIAGEGGHMNGALVDMMSAATGIYGMAAASMEESYNNCGSFLHYQSNAKVHMKNRKKRKLAKKSKRANRKK